MKFNQGHMLFQILVIRKSFHCSTKIKQKFLPVNLTMDSSRVFYSDSYAISRFFTTRQSFEISSVVKISKRYLAMMHLYLFLVILQNEYNSYKID